MSRMQLDSSRKADINKTIEKISEFHVEVEGFSGPLDLLCCLVESREIDVGKINVSEFVKIYGAFLQSTERASIVAIADFISAAAGILLGKVTSLLPSFDDNKEISEKDLKDLPSEEELISMLERYRPYRDAARYLGVLKKESERYFSRPVPDEPPLYDLGDLFGVSSLWWQLLRDKQANQKRDKTEAENMFMDGVPLAVPEEQQVENRISELGDIIREVTETDLKQVLGSSPSVSNLVVTVLALLEMSRLGEIRIFQERMFGNVRIIRDDSPQRT